ncbi:MAG: hypothetical protein K2F65_07170 [Eubacterium sp.]|nr:hypothetical protein [Eubacterium sp.]
MSEKKEAKKAKKAEKKAAKKAGKKGDKAFKVIIAVLLVAAIVGEFYIGLTMPSKIQDAVSTANPTSAEGGDSAAASLTFTPNTYAGVKFETQEDVVKYYVEAYNKTKSQTAQYKDADGNTQTFYKMVGTENLELKEGSLLLDGAPANSMISGMIGPVLSGVFSPNVNGMPPCANRNPDEDKDENGDSMTACRVTPEDVEAVSVEEKDGKVVLTLMPKAVNMSHKGLDAQGHFFNALGAIDSTVEGIGVEWASGTTADNCKVNYEQGTAVVTIDPASGEIVEADYTMNVQVDVTHVNFKGVIKDRGAALTLIYTQHFPADDDYLMKTRKLVRL